ncbi:MAG TPA: hypothetical protein VG842_11675, partial [Sediminibacterium sp.]|nr:hypothetical protein [Sediminibacterium sp.]
VYYKKFIIISGYYKIKDYYSHNASLSVDHFKARFEGLGYFKDKNTQIWKSPQLFDTFQDVQQYRDDLIIKLKADGYVVVTLNDYFKPEGQ